MFAVHASRQFKQSLTVIISPAVNTIIAMSYLSLNTLAYFAAFDHFVAYSLSEEVIHHASSGSSPDNELCLVSNITISSWSVKNNIAITCPLHGDKCNIRPLYGTYPF